VLLQVQERLGLELERALGDRDELLQERDDLVASAVAPGMVLLAGLVPTDLVREERRDGVPVSSRACRVELADRPFVRMHGRF
jgi:hypothetical protein